MTTFLHYYKTMLWNTKMCPGYFVIFISTIIVVISVNAIDRNATCGNHEWACEDESCVRVDQKCDGTVDCEDGSDEALATCKGIQRPMFGMILHCTSSWSDLHSGVCPDICRSEPKYCYYALLAENGSPGTCILPAFPKNGSYGITDIAKSADSKSVDFSLKFTCNEGTVLVGDTSSRCANGRWSAEFPYCSEYCKLNKKPGYSYKCTKDSKKDAPCGEQVAIGTTVAVERQVKKDTPNAVAYVLCTETHNFNSSSKCIKALESRVENFEKEEIQKISYFEAEFNRTDEKTFKFAKLVKDYREFEGYVNGNSTQLKQKAEECDIYLELLDTSSQA